MYKKLTCLLSLPFSWVVDTSCHMINWRSRRLDFQNMLSCQNCWFKLICNPNVPKPTYPRDDRHTAVKTRHGVQSRQSRGPPRLDTWTRESQWLRPTAAAGCCFIFQPVGYWWPVGGIATTSNQPILELQFMQNLHEATPRIFRKIGSSVAAKAANYKHINCLCMFLYIPPHLATIPAALPPVCSHWMDPQVKNSPLISPTPLCDGEGG